MANKTICMLRLKQIFKLKSEGKSNREIARLLGIHRETVRSYINEAAALGLSVAVMSETDEKELYEWFGQPEVSRGVSKGRSQKLYAMFPYIQKELGKTGVDRQVLFQEYKNVNPDGYSYNHFCREYRLWCVARDVAGVMEHKAGDKAFVDFAGKKLQITDRDTGEVKAVEVFVGILGFSQFTYVEATVSQKRDEFISVVENMLHYIGGVPAAIVPDNLKSAVYKANKYEPELNESFERFAFYYGTTILPTRSRKPKDKAPVEGAVKIVYRRIYALLRNKVFFSIEELNADIRELLIPYNNKTSKNASDTRANLLSFVEKNELRPLPADRYEMFRYAIATVYKTSYIMLQEDKHYYTVPCELIGKKIKIAYNSKTVEIYYRLKHVASHKRNLVRGGRTTNDAHLPANIQFVNELNFEKIISWASSVGPCTTEVITNIIDNRPHPDQARKSCMGILQMSKKVGKERLEKACQRAIYYNSYRYRVIKLILEKKLDMEPLQIELELEQYQIGDHENIRGNSYYK
jgi:transposase